MTTDATTARACLAQIKPAALDISAVAWYL